MGEYPLSSVMEERKFKWRRWGRGTSYERSADQVKMGDGNHP